MHNQQRRFFREVWHLVRPYWTSEEKWRAYLLLFGMGIGIVLQVWAMAYFNNLLGVFYNALQTFNLAALLNSLVKYGFFLVVLVLIAGYANYFAGLLTNNWRRWLTNHYLDKWLHQHTFYALPILNQKMDNPDQRISEDLHDFPELTLTLLTGLFNSLLTLATFGIILWHLSGHLTIPLGTYGKLVIPGYMFWITLIYAAIGTYLTIKIGVKLPGLNYQQQQFNADFRFSLIRIREAAEQIALYHGERCETVQLRQKFSAIYNNYQHIIRLQKYLVFFTNGYSNLSNIVPILISIPRYFLEKLPVSFIVQVGKAFDQVMSALSYIIYSYTTIAVWHSVVNRLNEFLQLMQTTQDDLAQQKIKYGVSQTAELIIQDLHLTLPDGKVLLKQFNLVVEAGERVLLSGISGAGKSTLLRAIAGIWPFGEGTIIKPPQQGTLFLPQKPYLPLGCLREVLAYPRPMDAFSQDAYQQVLHDCGLTQLIAGLTQVRAWANELSLGEQQSIAFARIYLQKPSLLCLDEATSALDEASETRLYQQLVVFLPKTTIVSVGHRHSLRSLHNRSIEVIKQVRS